MKEYDPDKHFTLNEIVDMMPISRETVKRLLRDKKIPYDTGLNNKNYYHKSAVLELVKDMEHRRKIRAVWIDNGHGAYL